VIFSIDKLCTRVTINSDSTVGCGRLCVREKSLFGFYIFFAAVFATITIDDYC
jgi:hypothetical protein